MLQSFDRRSVSMRAAVSARISCVLLGACGALAAHAQDRADPAPCTGAIETRVTKDVETHHGVTVQDPYRWLEDWSDPQVRAWSEAQSACARRYLDALPQAPRIRARLTQLLTAASETAHYSLKLVGGRLFALRRAPNAQQPVLVWFDAQGNWDDPHVVLDPLQLDPSGQTTIDWHRPSDDGRLIAVSLSTGGSERGTLYVYDASGARTGEAPIHNVNNATAGGDLAWSPDGKGFFYTRYPQPGERPESELAFHQRVFYHRIGEPPAKDRYEYGAELPSIAAIRLRRHPSTQRILAWVQNGDSSEFRFALREPDGRWREFGQFGDGHFEAALGAGDDVYVLTRTGAPRGKVLRISARDLDFSRARTIVPESDGALASSFYWPDSPTLTVTQSALLLVYQVGGPTQLRAFSLKGAALPKPQTPELSQTSSVTPLRDGEVLFAVDTFTAPMRWFRYSFAAKQMRSVFPQPQDAGWTDVVVAREWAQSRDGTRVPVTILRLRDVETRGLLLTGYGGYGISLAPRFEREVRLLLEQGVAYAVANLRGGGEFGDEWRRQGRLTQKQNVFDDFIAAAEMLRRRGLAPAGKLAILGASNGGLLMGAVMTQRPDLAQAVIAKVGVFDSLRNELDANGVFNIPEFGTVKDPEQFAALRAYSPYHNVRDKTRYPPTLFITGANDSRVNPMHSRKMTARLQHADAAGAPILLRTSDSTGHGSGTPLAAYIEELTDAYAFVMEALDLPYRETAKDRGSMSDGKR